MGRSASKFNDCIYKLTVTLELQEFTTVIVPYKESYNLPDGIANSEIILKRHEQDSLVRGR
jgi:hypothetical protein